MALSPTGRKWIKRAGWALLALFMLFVVAVGGVVGALHTQWGRAKVAALVEDLASSPDMRIELEGLASVMPWDLRLGRLALGDSQGVWLEADELAVSVDIWPLLDGAISVNWLRADSIAYLRAPVSTEAPPEPPQPITLEIPQIPPVRLDELRIDRLAYHMPPAEGEGQGQVKTYRVEGSVSPEKGDFVLDLSAVELPPEDGGAPEGFRPDKVVLNARLDQEAGTLSVDASLQEGSGGLVASALGLEKGTAVSGGLQGSGPLDDWAGDLNVDIGGRSLLDGRVTLKLTRVEDTDRLHVGLAGDLEDVANLLPPDVSAMTGSTARLDAAVLLKDPAGTPALSVESLELDTPTLALNLSGALEDERLTADIRLEALEERLLRELTAGALIGAPVLTVTLEADQDKATAQLESGLGSLALPDLSSGPARISARLEAENPLDEAERVLDLTGQLVVEGLRPPEGVALDERLTTEFSLHMEEETRIAVRSLKLDNGENTLTAEGVVDLEAMQVDAHLSASLPHAGALFMLHPLNAAVNLEADAKGSFLIGEGGGKEEAGAGGIEVSLSGSLDDLQGLDPQLAALVGKRVEISAEADIGERAIILDSLEVDSRTGLKAKGRYGLENGSVQAELDVTPPDDFTLPGDAVRLAGLEPLHLTVEGDLRRMDVMARASAASVQLPDRSFHELRLELDAGVPLVPPAEQTPAQTAEDRFSLVVKSREANASLSSRYRLEPQRLKLSSMDLTAPGLSLGGNVELDLETLLAQGGLKLDAGNLAEIGGLVGVDISGSLSAEVTLTASGGTQGAAVTAQSPSISYAGTSVDSLDLRFESGNVMALAEGGGGAKLTLKTGRAGTEEAYAARLQLDADVADKAVNLALDAEGQAYKPYDLALEAALRPFDDTFSMTLSSLKGEYAGLPVQLRNPMELSLPDGGVRIADLALGVGEALVAVDGSLGPQQADLTARIEDLRLETVKSIDPEGLGSLPEGRVDADLKVRGSMQAPTANLELTASRIDLPEVEEGADLELPLLNLDVKGAYESRRLRLDAVLVNADDGSAKPLLTTDVSLPMRLTLEPFEMVIEETAPLDGKANGRIDLAMVQRMLGMTDQALGGKAVLNATIGGSISDPDVNGKLYVRKGRYENLKLGLVLMDLNIVLLAEGQEVRISKLTGTDGAGGSLRGEGSLTFEGDNPFEANISLSSLTPVHLDIFTGTLSGDVKFKGDLNTGAKVAGTLTVEHAELKLPQGLPPDVATIPVEHKNVKGAEEQEEQEKPGESAFPIRLKLNISIPGQFYVTGHGLKSEWEGKLNVTGDVSEPRVVGNLDVKRGTFDFLDKVFTIEEGSLNFTGASPPSPTIRVVTATQAQDVVARVIIQGTPDNLKISFSSEPYLPQNEILAAVLFGRRLDSLTPMQAIRLARAVDQLSGGSGGSSFNVLEDIKNILGVDELTAGEGKTGGTTLQAGKYITDDVYLKGSKGMDPRDDSVSVEVQISPNLGLESEMGGDSQGGIGLNWRYDY